MSRADGAPRPGSPSEGSGPWLRVASLAELAAGRVLRVRGEGMDVFLVMAGGAVYACDNTCAHQHFPVLHEGEFRECTVRCPMHGWTYDVRTGLSGTGEGRIATYPVMVKGGDVYIAFR
jgi:nitrite reductase/ring-hydroxylating ferredoxin subunit